MLCPLTVTFPWQHNGLHTLSIQRVKSEFLSIKKCYLLLLFIPWVSVNMDITRHKQKTVCYTLDQQLRHFSFWESRGLVPSLLLWWHHNQYHYMCSSCSTSTLQNFNLWTCTDIPYLVVLHNFVSTLWHHKSSNLHKSKSSVKLTTKNAVTNYKMNVILHHFESSS